MIEEWKEIKGCQGYYISSYGQVKGVRSDKPYKTHLNKKGYPIVRIPKYDFSKGVHRVVASHFIGESPLQVNHKDGNKLNNHVSNLEYMTCKENINHAIKTGLRSATINLKSNAMFDSVQLGLIRDAINNGFKNTEIARFFNCDHSTISKIRRGHHYPAQV